MAAADFAAAGSPGRGSTAGDFVRSRFGGWVPRNHPDAMPDDEPSGPVALGDPTAGLPQPADGPRTLGDLVRPRAAGGESPIAMGDPSAMPPQPFAPAAPDPAPETAPAPAPDSDPTTLGEIKRSGAPTEEPGSPDMGPLLNQPPSTPQAYAPPTPDPAYGGYDQPNMVDLQQRAGSMGSLAESTPGSPLAPASDTPAQLPAPLARRRRPRNALGDAGPGRAAFGSLGRMASAPAWGGR